MIPAQHDENCPQQWQRERGKAATINSMQREAIAKAASKAMAEAGRQYETMIAGVAASIRMLTTAMVCTGGGVGRRVIARHLPVDFTQRGVTGTHARVDLTHDE